MGRPSDVTKLGDCIVVTVAATAHAGLQAVYFEEVLPVVARVLTALVAVNRHSRSWLSSPHRHQQRI